MYSNEISQIDQACVNHWGCSFRTHVELLNSSLPRLFDFLDYDQLSDTGKVHIAEKLLRESTPHVGIITDCGDVRQYLHSFAYEMAWSKGSSFDDRRSQAMKSALLMIVYSMPMPLLQADDDLALILAGGKAPAAMYLLAQLEYLFRCKCRYVNIEGMVVRAAPQQLRAKTGLSANVRRINQVRQMFLLYLYRNRVAPAPRLRAVEKDLRLSERLGRIRNPAMHGSLPDPGVEGYLYGLLLAMFYFSESVP